MTGHNCPLMILLLSIVHCAASNQIQWQLMGPSGRIHKPHSETMLSYTQCIPKGAQKVSMHDKSAHCRHWLDQMSSTNYLLHLWDCFTVTLLPAHCFSCLRSLLTFPMVSQRALQTPGGWCCEIPPLFEGRDFRMPLCLTHYDLSYAHQLAVAPDNSFRHYVDGCNPHQCALDHVRYVSHSRYLSIMWRRQVAVISNSVIKLSCNTAHKWTSKQAYAQQPIVAYPLTLIPR